MYVKLIKSFILLVKSLKDNGNVYNLYDRVWSTYVKNDDKYYVDTFCRTTAVVKTTNPKSKNKSKFDNKLF